jgi:hypothetical protein
LQVFKNGKLRNVIIVLTSLPSLGNDIISDPPLIVK